jgi:hypothetical protein
VLDEDGEGDQREISEGTIGRIRHHPRRGGEHQQWWWECRSWRREAEGGWWSVVGGGGRIVKPFKKQNRRSRAVR